MRPSRLAALVAAGTLLGACTELPPWAVVNPRKYGFDTEELDISVADRVLVIRGRQAEGRERTYLYQGIAARRFQRSFVLGDELEVSGAVLRNGLLSIDLSRQASGEEARTIAKNEPE